TIIKDRSYYPNLNGSSTTTTTSSVTLTTGCKSIAESSQNIINLMSKHNYLNNFNNFNKIMNRGAKTIMDVINDERTKESDSKWYKTECVHEYFEKVLKTHLDKVASVFETILQNKSAAEERY